MSSFEVYERQPVDVIFETIPEWKPGSMTPEDLLECVELQIGRSIIGLERTYLLDLATEELAYDYEQFCKESGAIK